jgi:hypothetical protein
MQKNIRANIIQETSGQKNNQSGKLPNENVRSVTPVEEENKESGDAKEIQYTNSQTEMMVADNL